ncbi:glutamine amidotransferase [Nocardioides sp.]|uniref:glutamine amidotransferase n=1 Tax=Nocardioides sp. TaxID=35761 RepID=UPI0027202BE3|nr:glutamine amidotransferase [Nocardioides sp.]MDO9456003.1 glutamine amidotransferase [Nocardioides sp.]
MRPFLLLSIRSEQAAADDEHAAFARFLGVEQDEVHRRLLGVDDVGDVASRLDDWSGVLLGGGSFTWSDDAATKSAAQLRAEADLVLVLDAVVEADFPFLGACYGIGTLGGHQGGLVDRAFPEPVGPLSVTTTEAGRADPLFAGVPAHFAAYGGHKEALTRPPAHAVVLATSEACPVQAFRVGEHVYATQFHPELDLAGLHTRIDTYATHGYFDPSEADTLRAAGAAVEVAHPMTLLRNFARRYRR